MFRSQNKMTLYMKKLYPKRSFLNGFKKGLRIPALDILILGKFSLSIDLQVVYLT